MLHKVKVMCYACWFGRGCAGRLCPRREVWLEVWLLESGVDDCDPPPFFWAVLMLVTGCTQDVV